MTNDNKLAEVERAIRKVVAGEIAIPSSQDALIIATLMGAIGPVIARLLDAAREPLEREIYRLKLNLVGPAIEDRIKRERDAAHVDALRAAALEVCVYCQRGVPMKSEDYHDNTGSTSDASSECFKYPFCDGARIRRLLPERARLLRELEVARVAYDEAKWWTHAVALSRTERDRLDSAAGRVADLEAELAALKEK